MGNGHVEVRARARMPDEAARGHVHDPDTASIVRQVADVGNERDEGLSRERDELAIREDSGRNLHFPVHTRGAERLRGRGMGKEYIRVGPVWDQCGFWRGVERRTLTQDPREGQGKGQYHSVRGTRSVHDTDSYEKKLLSNFFA